MLTGPNIAEEAYDGCVLQLVYEQAVCLTQSFRIPELVDAINIQPHAGYVTAESPSQSTTKDPNRDQSYRGLTGSQKETQTWKCSPTVPKSRSASRTWVGGPISPEPQLLKALVENCGDKFKSAKPS